MNARKLINFFRSPPGLLLLFLGGVGLMLFLMHSCGLSNPSKNEATNKRRQEFQDALTKLQTGVPSAEFPNTNTPKAEESTRPASQPNPKPEPPPLTLYAASQPVVRLSKRYAPFGRLVKCQLIITVDSSVLDTPIIGLVIEDVNHDGRLIIPAGTEVHGKARKTRTRDRIGSENDWVLVFRENNDGFKNGEELSVHGIALDMEEVVQGEKWAITDGSAGIRGDVLKTDDFEEIKLFAATAISGLARGVQNQTVSPVTGAIITTGSAKNSLLEGAGAAADRYAQLILDSIEKDGYFVRVGAGKQFYLYVTETMDQHNAKIGGQLRPADQANPPNVSSETRTSSDAPIPRTEGEVIGTEFPVESPPPSAPSPSPETPQRPAATPPAAENPQPNDHLENRNK
jgi:hypothetical protein